MKIQINGHDMSCQEGQSILEVALENDIYIPHLCKHPDLEASGGCRLCSVEVEGVGVPVPSCATLATDGMRVTTNSPAAEATRKMALELILASHPGECTGCPKYGKCELQSMYQYLGVSAENWQANHRSLPDDKSNPLIEHLFTRCVRCGRCVHACRDMRGGKVLDFQRVKGTVRIGTDDGLPLAEAGCRFCGACIEVCPTGSIMDAAELMPDGIPYGDSVVPCRSECPAGIDIPRYIRYVKEGRYDKATAVVCEKAPFPATLGRICSHACETKCKRGHLGDPVSICRLKLAAASQSEGGNFLRMADSTTGKKVAVVGAGPSGLTAAYCLGLKGHAVTILEANQEPGGQCRYGIPAYRLAETVLKEEIDRIVASGDITIKTGVRIEDTSSLLALGYDAVCIATGTHQGVRLSIDGSQLEGVLLNTDFLKSIREGNPMPVGKRVVVLGGGSVAFDCARSALRLGADTVHVACLESREQMTADDQEIQEGVEEGVILHDAYSFVRIGGDQKVEGVELKKVSSFRFNENRQVEVETVEGSEVFLEADTVVFAVGQRPENTDAFGVKLVNGYIHTDDACMTDKPGVYAAGDVVYGTQSVIKAIAAGRDVAASIDRYLGGDGVVDAPVSDDEQKPDWLGRIEGFADLQRVAAQTLPASARRATFEMAEQPYDQESSCAEASRCLQCDLRLEISRPHFWSDFNS